MFTLPQWIARLTKGYIKATGKQPDGLANLKIKMEAAQKVKDQGKVVKGNFNPKETEAQIKARMIKENRSNVQKSYLRQLDERIMKEMDLTKADLENMSSTALDDLRRNADPVGMKKNFDEITEGRGLGDFPDDPFKDDFASGGIARVGFKKGTTRSRLQKDWKSYATLKDLLYGSPPVAWVSPDKWSSQRDDEITRLKERFMYGEPTLKKDFSILDALKEDPTLEKIKAWREERKEKASGGIARVGYFKGGKVWKEFIEKLFIKTSNDIRQGKGKWKGLTQSQWIKQHDDLTKMLKKWEWGGKKKLPEGAEQYIGMNDLQVTRAIKEAEKKVKKTGEIQPSFSLSREKLMTQFPHISEGEIDRIMRLPVEEQKQVLTKLMGDLTEIRGGQGIKGMDERTALKIKYPGLTDDLLNKILIDDNPQRKAEVLATMDEFLKLKEVGKGDEEAFDIITKSFKKTPTKHASGGIAGQLHLNRPGYQGGYLTRKQYPPSLSSPVLRDEARKKREEATFEAMWRGAPPSMKEREKMYRKERTATKMEEERIEAFAKKINERKKRYPYADMTEKEFAEAHPKVYDFMKKDPNWNWETFKKVSFANPGETFQATGARDIGLPLGQTDRETLELFMTPFGEKNYEMSSEGPFNKTKIMSDQDKAQVALHELRHKGILDDDELTAAQPPLAVEISKLKKSQPGSMYPGSHMEMPLMYRHLNPSGSKEKFSSPLDMHEIFTRFMDRQYGSLKTPSGPYFDKIWRDKWKPYAEKYEKILKERKDPERGVEVLAAKGGLAKVLGV